MTDIFATTQDACRPAPAGAAALASSHRAVADVWSSTNLASNASSHHAVADLGSDPNSACKPCWGQSPIRCGAADSNTDRRPNWDPTPNLLQRCLN